jgi:hypothetical protein
MFPERKNGQSDEKKNQPKGGKANGTKDDA